MKEQIPIDKKFLTKLLKDSTTKEELVSSLTNLLNSHEKFMDKKNKKIKSLNKKIQKYEDLIIDVIDKNKIYSGRNFDETVEHIDDKLQELKMNNEKLKEELNNKEEILKEIRDSTEVTEENAQQIFKEMQKTNPFAMCFPYAEPRIQQINILKQLDKYKDKKYIIIEALPGTGKSAIADAIAKAEGTSYILTATKQLQDQYLNEFGIDLVDLRGSGNYLCSQEHTVCTYGPCKSEPAIKMDCIHNDMCPYQRQKALAQKSFITLTSYAYFFTFMDTEQDITKWQTRDTVIFDEAHLLESQITEWASVKFDPLGWHQEYDLFDTIQEVMDDKLEAMIRTTTPPNYQHYNKDAIREEIILYRTILQKKASKIIAETKKMVQSKEKVKLLQQHRTLTNIVNKLSVLVNDKNDDNWSIVPVESNSCLMIQPLNTSSLFMEYVNKWAKKQIIFMSATILSPSLFCQTLGIDKKDVGLIRIDTSFDPNKSPIYFLPAGKMNYNSVAATMPKAIEIVKNILEQYKDERGIIHTGNYSIANNLTKSIRDKRLSYKQGYDTNETLLAKHAKKKNSVLVSPAFGTGTDLHDDLSRFQIIMKLPFLSLADQRVKKKAKINNDWYNIEMLRALIQSCGRSTRSEDDYSDTYILDESFLTYIKRYQKLLPKSFLQRIRVKH